MDTQTELADRFAAVCERIRNAEQRFGRPAGCVRLLAVSKTFPVAQLAQLAACGQRLFGENYLQEALPKIAALQTQGLEWHFIGHIQSNKTRDIASHFAWVHSLDRIKIAERLSAARSAQMPPLQVCIEVNVSGEASKSGVAPAEIPALAEAVAALPNLVLRGLMALPEPSADFATQRRNFAAVRHALDALATRGLRLDTLSMGTSSDLEAAIAEGATIVRIGTALFGPRRRV